MSDGHEGVRQASQVISQAIGDHINAPPLRQNLNRAEWGAGLVAGGAYVGYSYVQGVSLAEAVQGYIGVLHRPFDESWPFYAWGAAVLLGLLWVAVGVRGTRGLPRDTMIAFWALFRIGLAVAALWYGWYLDDYPVMNWFLKGIYIMVLSSSVMLLYLCLRGPGRGAAHAVQTHISSTARFFRLGRRRSF